MCEEMLPCPCHTILVIGLSDPYHYSMIFNPFHIPSIVNERNVVAKINFYRIPIFWWKKLHRCLKQMGRKNLMLISHQSLNLLTIRRTNKVLFIISFTYLKSKSSSQVTFWLPLISSLHYIPLKWYSLIW